MNIPRLIPMLFTLEIANNMYEIYFLQKRYLVLWWGIVYFIWSSDLR